MTPFAHEIAQIKSTYAEFAARDYLRTRWAPFAESESDVRAQQLLAFSRMMRTAGFLHLEGQRILDLGCGSGRHLRQCIDMGAAPGDLHGIDLDAAAIELGRKLSPDLDIALGTGDTIEFPDATFDLVTHYFAFSSMPGEALRRRLAAEISRVLKPDGCLFWWDMRHMAEAAGGRAESLDAGTLFPGRVVVDLALGAKSAPSETLRAGWLRRWLGPLLDRFAPAPTFQVALIRPHSTAS
jgi:ubiquinone/menaquinone biosynthesis C-methylase UbiE